MNLLILSGSLGRDPERKNFQNSSVVTFSLAETVLANGEKKEAEGIGQSNPFRL